MNPKMRSRSDPHPNFDSLPLISLNYKTLLLSSDLLDHDTARDLVASVLTRHKGEYVFRIGSQPPLAKLISGESIDGPGWTGTPRTKHELEKLRNHLTNTVEELGGKVSTLFESQVDHPRASLLLRLPPLSVAHTPEVRCAVVGNVDRYMKCVYPPFICSSSEH
jgi:hypothetical protein